MIHVSIANKVSQAEIMTKGSIHVHIAPAYVGSGEGCDNFESTKLKKIVLTEGHSVAFMAFCIC
jgi:hypothetical protein